MGTISDSADPDEMQHNAAFHQCLHCLLSFATPFRNRNISLFREKIPVILKYKMDNPILLIVSICIGKSIRLQRLKQ